MKTILSSIAAGSVLSILAAAQPPRSIAVDAGVRAPGATKVQSSNRSVLVYVITGGSQFGIVDLRSGTFLPIGPGTPPDVGGGLVPGQGTSLLTLAFSGNLDAIDPLTGKTSVVGATGLRDCSMPGSYDLLCANVLGRSNGTLYATDFAQNLYAVEPKTGAAKLIGPTGVPALPFAPLTQNPDGSLNVFDESLFSFRGKLFVNFGALTFNPATGKAAPVIPAALYEIDHKTGHATWIAPIDAGITTIVNVSDTVYGFRSATEEVVTLDVTNGRATPVSELDPAARVVGGATPARPSSEDDR